MSTLALEVVSTGATDTQPDMPFVSHYNKLLQVPNTLSCAPTNAVGELHFRPQFLRKHDFYALLEEDTLRRGLSGFPHRRFRGHGIVLALDRRHGYAQRSKLIPMDSLFTL